jgi:hypothetical protein
VPNLEVFNYGLSGTGTDQQYLTYLDCADVEHDLVIIGLYLDNIDRVARRFQVFRSESGREVVYSKPYYKIEDDDLVLHHVPVPKALLTRAMIPAEDLPHVAESVAYPRLRKIARQLGMRDLVRKFIKPQPAPLYNSPHNTTWLLLRKILETWIHGSNTPVLVFVIPMRPYIEETSDPRNYQARFRELASDTGCYLHDPLPDLWKYPIDQRREFCFKHDSHISPQGHRALAASLASAVERVMQTAAQREPAGLKH